MSAAFRKFLTGNGAAIDMSRLNDHELADIGISRGDVFPANRTYPFAAASGPEIIGFSNWLPATNGASNDGNRRVP